MNTYKEDYYKGGIPMFRFVDLLSTAVTLISLIVNFLILLPQLYKWLTDKRHLRAILGSKNHYFWITQSLFGPGSLSTNFIDNYTLITKNSAISCQKVAKLLDDAEIKYNVINDPDVPQYDEIHIGGPISNQHTNAYFKEYFTNFYFFDKVEKQQQHQKYYNIHRELLKYSDDFNGFQIGNTKYPIDEETDYMVLVKLTSDDLGCEKTVHLLFGGGDVASLVAADFFTKHYKILHSKAKRRHYFFVIPVHKTTQTPQISSMEDLTEQMFDFKDLEPIPEQSINAPY